MYIACFNVFSLSDIGLHRILARTYFKSFGFTRTRPGVTNTPERAETYANCPSRNSIDVDVDGQTDITCLLLSSSSLLKILKSQTGYRSGCAVWVGVVCVRVCSLAGIR